MTQPINKDNSIKETAGFLKLSGLTLYGHVHRALIPVMKKTKRLYFSKKELADMVKTGRKKTVAEIDSETDQYLTNKKKGM